MLKQSVLALMLSFSISAYSAVGPYIGAGVGPDFAIFKQKAHIVHASNLNVIDKERHGASGIYGTFFAGYGLIYRFAYLAAELNINGSTLQFHSSNNEYVHRHFSQTSYKINSSYGVSLLPGYLLANSVLLYGRLGYSRGNFEVDTLDRSLRNINPKLNGFRYGLGMQTPITPKFAMRFDWSQISYETVSMFTLDHHSNTTKGTKITPLTNEVEFDLIYQFC